MNNESLTAIVATFQRHDELGRLLSSIARIRDRVSIVVADSSYEAREAPGAETVFPKTDCGISAARNLALGRVGTEYTLLLDDDYELPENVDFSAAIDLCEREGLGICGGSVHNVGDRQFDFHGTYVVEDGTLFHFVDIPRSATFPGRIPLWDTIFNFFVAKTDVLRGLGGWDAELKFAREHDDFFLRAAEKGVRVGYFPDMSVNHHHGKKFHGGTRGRDCTDRFLKKWAITEKVEVRASKAKLEFWRFGLSGEKRPIDQAFIDRVFDSYLSLGAIEKSCPVRVV